MLLRQTANILLKTKKTIAIAESCTGGLVSHYLTNISGSSGYFKLGLILYSSDTKSKLLKIDKKTISRFGAVSDKIASLMARHVKTLAKTDLGLAVTGFAGPKGGNKNNPVGTVYIAIAYKDLTFVRKYLFSGTRTQIKNKAKNKALCLIRQCLNKP